MNPVPLYKQIIRNLRAKVAKYQNHYEALEIFETAWDGSRDLTMLGAYVSSECHIPFDQIRNILWLTIEVPGSAPKEYRFREIPTKVDLISEVQAFHGPFHKKGWRKITEKWLTMSDILETWQKRYQNLRGLVLLSNESQVAIFETLSIYSEGEVALIYPNSKKEYMIRHAGKKPLILNEFFEKEEKRFELVAKWLGSFKEKVDVYFGFEDNKKTRVWCALNPGFNLKDFLQGITHLPSKFNYEFAEDINNCVSEFGPLETFLRKTNSLDVHGNGNRTDRDKAFGELMSFLGTTEKSFVHKIQKYRHRSCIKFSVEQIQQCMITMCGKKSLLRKDGDQPLSIMGAFLYLLGAIATKYGDCFPKGIEYKLCIKDHNSIRNEGILPYQSPKTCEATIRAMFETFLRLTWDKEQGRVLKKVYINDRQLELRLNIDATVPREGRPSPLCSSVGLYLAGKHKGDTSSAFGKFFVKSHTCDTGVRNPECIFPPACRVELGYKDGETVFRLIKPSSGGEDHWP